MCVKHKKYKAIHIPKVNCIDCWDDWMAAHPNTPITAKHLQGVFKSLTAELLEIGETARTGRGLAKAALDVSNGLYK